MGPAGGRPSRVHFVHHQGLLMLENMTKPSSIRTKNAGIGWNWLK